MNNLIYVCLAPIAIILLTIYLRDKYEKEPIPLAFVGTLFGILSSIPILLTEKWVLNFIVFNNYLITSLYNSFVVASFVEESYKYIVLLLLIYKNKNYNEPFDGILYSVYISLGFATVENIIYVFNPKIGGLYTGILRGLFSVPAHGIFGVYMGYYLSKYKFFKVKSKVYSLVIPIFIHGIYDFILCSKLIYSQLLFIIYFAYILIISIKRINYYIKISPFKCNKN